jgi:phospholipase C
MPGIHQWLAKYLFNGFRIIIATLAARFTLNGAACRYDPAIQERARQSRICDREEARMRRPVRAYAVMAAAGLFTAMAFGLTSAIASGAITANGQHNAVVLGADHGGTATPIKHLVVIFDENISFDHYFGTYPYAANPPGEPAFHAKSDTPTVNGLYNQLTSGGQPTGPLLTSNPNLSNPERLDRADPMTCDQGHGYTQEQSAADQGAMDKFVQTTGKNKTLMT